MSEQGLSYQTSGVDVGEAQRALRGFTDTVRSTFTPEVLSDVGAFGGLYAADFGAIGNPVLVASIDGVGTKTAVAQMLGQYRGLGLDIVNHCANDILAQGARPIFFLDYFASSKLIAEVVSQVVDGAAEACRDLGCPLLGGETAEMPGIYRDGQLDVVGAIVGIVERDKILPTSNIEGGDLLVGIASNGLHTNGFSLARAALFESGKKNPNDLIPDLGRTIGEELLRPHRCYVRAILPILEEGDLIKGLAHITGGGFAENVPRILGPEARAVIERRTWIPPVIFSIIQEAGQISDEEMYRVFNMGIGMIAVCASEHAAAVVQRLHDSGETAYVVGEVTKGARGVNVL